MNCFFFRFSFVCAHLTAHKENLGRRIADYKHIVGTLLFPPVSKESRIPSTIYSTSHLFFLGDLNFRLDVPPSSHLSSIQRTPEFARALDDERVREEVKEYDQLLVQRRRGSVFVGLHEGEFWRFKCSYKYQLGEVDKYWSVFFQSPFLILSLSILCSSKRTLSWTDRVLYATYTDSPESLSESNITNLLYTSIPSYTTSDHVSSS